MFPEQGESGVAAGWIKELNCKGREVYGFTDNTLSDAELILKILKRNNIGIIHTHFISMKQYLSIYIATIFCKKKVVMHFHNHSVQANGIKDKLRQMLYRKCTMIGCSQSVYENLCRDYPKNKKVAVNNGIQFERLKNVPAAHRSEYGLKVDSVVCLIFGFDFYRKGVDLALNALNNLNKNGLECELLISLSKNFEYVEQETKKILGYTPSWVHIIKARSDVAALYNMSSLFLSPSREEGLPYSVLEAGYCECGVVTSDIPAQAKLNIPFAILHTANDYNSLEEKIKIALQKNNEKKYKMQEVRDFMHLHYSLDSWVNSILDIYKSEWEELL